MKQLMSIIIPCFNREDFIHETLTSIQQQTFKNFECIIVDDGSNDATLSIIQGFAKKDNRFKPLQREREPKGANTCRNIGFEHSKGEYIVWFDSDDVMLANYLEVQLKTINASETDFNICRLEKFDSETGRIFGYLRTDWNTNNALDFTRGYIKYIWGVVTNSFIWKRAFLEKQGHLFDENLVHADEYEFIARLLCFNDYKFSSVNEVLFRYRQHEHNYANSINKGDENRTISALHAKSQVLRYALKENLIDPDLYHFFISDSLQYLKYGYSSTMGQLIEILDSLEVKSSGQLISNYQYVCATRGFFKPTLSELSILSTTSSRLALRYKLYYKGKVKSKVKRLFSLHQ